MNPLLDTCYSRAIRLTPGGFSFYRQDSTGEMCIRHCKYTENELITTCAPDFFEFENSDIRPLNVVMATRIPILIPDTLYDDSKSQDYLRLQYDLTHFAQHYSDQLAQYRALYFLEQQEHATLNNMACLPHFVCDATLLYRFLESRNLSDALLLSMNDTFADLIVLHKQEPVLINRLQHIDNMDILYHIINNIRQFGLTAPTIFVQYFYDKNPKLNKLLMQYLPDIIIL